MKKPYKSWPCGCYATSPKHIKICDQCGDLQSWDAQRALWRAHARMRSMAKEEAKKVAKPKGRHVKV